MAKLITLSTPEWGVSNGMELSFNAPCDCTGVTGISLDGITYEIVDTSGNSLTSCSNYFSKGAILTVIIDTVNKKATLLNPRVNTYTKTLGTPDDTASASGSTLWSRVKQIVLDLATKASKIHTHTKSEITDFAHTHDERYYTETEMDSKLSGKSNTGHKHTKSEITDFDHHHNDLYFTEAEVLAELSKKSDTSHIHDGRYYTQVQIAEKLALKSDTTHTHDERYYKKDEIDGKLKGKSDTGHTHTKSEITDFPKSMPASDVYTWAKASTKPSYTADEVGAYSKSETNSLLDKKSATGHNHDDRYYKKDEIDEELEKKSDTGHKHTKSEITDFAHNHDDSYYTKGAIDTKLNDKSNTGHKHTKSEITDFPASMPASDVYDWAKASSKPSYTASEVGAYSKGEVDTKLSGKSDASHTHPEYAMPTVRLEELEYWQANVNDGTTAVGSANWASGDLKELLNVMINYAGGKKVSGSGSNTPDATKTSDGYPCAIDIEFPSVAIVESATLDSHTGFNSTPDVMKNGNVVTVSGFTNTPPGEGAFQIKCSATVTALLKPKLIS